MSVGHACTVMNSLRSTEIPRTLWLNVKYRGTASGERRSVNDAPLLKALLYLLVEDVFKGEYLGARDKDNIELWQEILTAAAAESESYE